MAKATTPRVYGVGEGLVHARKILFIFFSHILSLKVLLVGCNLVSQMLGLLLTQLLKRPFVTDVCSIVLGERL